MASYTLLLALVGLLALVSLAHADGNRKKQELEWKPYGYDDKPTEVDCGCEVRFKWKKSKAKLHLEKFDYNDSSDDCRKTPKGKDLMGESEDGDYTYILKEPGYYSFSSGDDDCKKKNFKKVYKVKHCDPPICFPETSSVRRVSDKGALETVALPALRIGDSVECFVREPVIRADGSVTTAAFGQLSTCQVYDYKKAASATEAEYTFITYDRPEAAKPGVLAASPNHHILNPVSGHAVMANSFAANDDLLVLEDGALITAHVLSVKNALAKGAFVPLLTKGGLPIVDGAVVYPSSGESDVGLDAKFWGQYFLSAPVWQALQAKASNDAAGKSLAELGAKEGMEVGAFTQKFYAVAAAAAKEGRTFKDWAGVAAEMRAAIAGGKVYSEEEALAVYNKHIKAPVAATA